MRINFETDLLKHYVRKYGWLAAAREQKEAIKNRSKKIPLRYFTFCAAEAIDVFMLELDGILERSEDTERLEGVYFCEADPDKFGIIADLIGSPEQGFQGEFEKIVLFEDDDDTRGKTFEDDEFHSAEIRKKLRYKDAHQRFREAFPFDIINLDVCGVMFPPRKGIMTPLLKSITQILEWQTKTKSSSNERECNHFTLFLTAHVNQDLTDQIAIQQLMDTVSNNISTIPDFQKFFAKRYRHDQVHKLVSENFAEFFSIALPKFIIQQDLFNRGWQVDPGPTYLFHRDNKWNKNKPYQIMHAVSACKRIPNFHKQVEGKKTGQYHRSVTKLINNGVEWVDSIIENPEFYQELKEHLNEIITLRKMRSGI